MKLKIFEHNCTHAVILGKKKLHKSRKKNSFETFQIIVEISLFASAKNDFSLGVNRVMFVGVSSFQCDFYLTDDNNKCFPKILGVE